jgi:hypothetical protein
VSFGHRILVLLDRLLGFLDAPGEHAVAGDNLKPANGRPLRQREGVDGFDRLALQVDERLLDRRPLAHTGKPGAEADAPQRDAVGGVGGDQCDAFP